MGPVKIAPSILAADFARLGAQVEDAVAAGAGHIHVDVMDGHFVPNITIGPLIVRAIWPLVPQDHVVLDVHLMITEPARYIEAFAEAGADLITVHVEADHHLHRTVEAIQQLGVRAGVALNPATPLTALAEILPYADLLLIMTVNPGFGGQRYIPASTDKIRRLRQMMTAVNSDADLEVDGGVKTHNAAEIVAAGANVLVAGSAIFNARQSVEAATAEFRSVLPMLT